MVCITKVHGMNIRTLHGSFTPLKQYKSSLSSNKFLKSHGLNLSLVDIRSKFKHAFVMLEVYNTNGLDRLIKIVELIRARYQAVIKTNEYWTNHYIV